MAQHWIPCSPAVLHADAGAHTPALGGRADVGARQWERGKGEIPINIIASKNQFRLNASDNRNKYQWCGEKEVL